MQRSTEEILKEYSFLGESPEKVTEEVSTETPSSSFSLDEYLKKEYNYSPKITDPTLQTVQQDPQSLQTNIEIPTFDSKAYTKQQESSGNYNVGYHKGPAKAWGAYGITPNTWTEIQKANPEFANRDITSLKPEEQDKAYDVNREVLKKQLVAKGVEPSESNINMAHFLGAGGTRYYLSTGKVLDEQAAQNGGQENAKNIAEARRLGIPIKEYTKAISLGENPTSRFVVQKQTQAMANNGFRVIDGDTVELENGDRIRIKGTNAREIPGYDYETAKFKGGEFGGEFEKKIAEDIMLRKGFVFPVKGKFDEKKKRFEGDFMDAQGNLFSDYMIRNNLTSLTEFSTPEQQLASGVGRIEAAGRAAREPANRFDLVQAGVYDLENPEDYMRAQLTNYRSQIDFQTKPYADTAKDFGQNPEWYAGPGMIRHGENRAGIATSTISTGLDLATNNLKRSFSSVADMAYFALGDEDARRGFKRTKEYYDGVEQMLPMLANPEAFDSKTGEWKLDTLNKFGDWFVGTAAQSAPDMPMAMISRFLLVPTMGLSAIPGVLRFAGEIWNDQPENKKSVWSALGGGAAMQAAELVGASAVMKAMAPREIAEKAIKDIMIKKNKTRELAEQEFIQASKGIYKQMFEVIKAVPRSVPAGIEEGLTESFQDIIGHFAKQGFDLTVSDPVALKNQMLNSFMGGFALGGGIAVGGKAYNIATYSYDTSPKPTDIKFREDNYESQGKTVPFAYEVVDNAASNNVVDNASLDNLAAPEESKRNTANFTSQVKNWWSEKGMGSLFHKGWNKILGQFANTGENMAAFSTIVGANNFLNGGNVYTEKELFSGLLTSQLGPIRTILNNFKGLKTEAISDLMYKTDVRSYIDAVNNYADTNGVSFADASSIVDITKHVNPANLKYSEAITDLANKINNMATTYGERMGSKFTASKFLNNKDVNKDFINSNRKQFVQDLMKAVNGLSYNNAVQYVEALMTNDNSLIDSLDFNTSLAQAAMQGNLDKNYITNKIKQDTTGLLNKYLHNSLFDNISSFTHAGGNRYVNQKFFGENGSKVAALLNEAIKAGEITVDQASFLAKEFKDFLKVRTGDYHRVDNQLVNGGLNLISFLTTISSLPLAAISSMTEFGLVMRNLNTRQSLEAYQSLLSSLSKDLYATVKEIGSTNKHHDLSHREQLSTFGFETGEQNTENRYDIQSGVYSKLTGSFFKFTGLQSVTNATRYARLSIAEDALNNWYTTVKPALRDKTKMNQQQQDAYEHLVRLGFDPVLYAEINGEIPSNKFDNYTPEQMTRLRDDMRTMSEIAKHNFVNEAVAHPNPLNRPKFYSDPYLRLFTLFQGYMSSFTSTILPRLYGDLSKRGSADQKNAVAAIGAMIALSAFGLLLKDLIKFGESPPDWIKGDEKKLSQRLLGATGLLGTGERVVNFVNPLVEQRAENSFQKLYNIIEGESPPLAYLGKAGKALDSALSGKEDTAKKVMKVAPFVGSINQLGDYINDQLKGK
jgi:hypothetical protein